MTAEEYRSSCMDVIYLASCAVNGRVPDAGRVGKMDKDALYRAADRHMLSCITAMALESAGVSDDAFTQAKGKAVRKVAVFDIERAAVIDRLEKAGIWNVPLKGSVLKSLYPRIGMREMSDNDILYDATATPEVRKIMEDLGFSTDRSYGKGVHDHFIKPPVCNFEMHRTLFEQSQKKFYAYYMNVRERLRPNEGCSYSCRFSDEDFYIYIIAHEHKHYAAGGTGLRSLLDTYVFLKQKNGSLDRKYISGEMEKLGISDFEKQNRSLALHLFSGEELTGEDNDMLEYILSSGTYGTVSNRVRNGINRYGNGPIGKLRYVFRRIFLPLSVVRSAFPVFIKIPVLLPFLPFYRLFKGLAGHRDVMKAELETISKSR